VTGCPLLCKTRFCRHPCARSGLQQQQNACKVMHAPQAQYSKDIHMYLLCKVMHVMQPVATSIQKRACCLTCKHADRHAGGCTVHCLALTVTSVTLIVWWLHSQGDVVPTGRDCIDCASVHLPCSVC
jgi:hypothetical protein